METCKKNILGVLKKYVGFSVATQHLQDDLLPKTHDETKEWINRCLIFLMKGSGSLIDIKICEIKILIKDLEATSSVKPQKIKKPKPT